MPSTKARAVHRCARHVWCVCFKMTCCGEGCLGNILNKDDHNERAIYKETMSALHIARSPQDTQTPNISILGQWQSTRLHNRYSQQCLKASLLYYGTAISRLHNCTSPILFDFPLISNSALFLAMAFSVNTFLLVTLHLPLAHTVHSALCTCPSPRALSFPFQISH